MSKYLFFALCVCVYYAICVWGTIQKHACACMVKVKEDSWTLSKLLFSFLIQSRSLS